MATPNDVFDSGFLDKGTTPEVPTEPISDPETPYFGTTPETEYYGTEKPRYDNIRAIVVPDAAIVNKGEHQ